MRRLIANNITLARTPLLPIEQESPRRLEKLSGARCVSLVRAETFTEKCGGRNHIFWN